MEAQPHEAKPFDLLKPAHRYYDYEFERYWHFFQAFGRWATSQHPRKSGSGSLRSGSAGKRALCRKD